MNRGQIIDFYYVAKYGSFTKAAGAVFKTQSALTHQIKSLEEELECLLFERIGKRKIRLTLVGERLFTFAEDIIQKYDNLIDDLNEIKKLKKGRLSIAAPFTTLYHLLPLSLVKYTQQFPWVELTLLDRAQKDVVQLVKQGDVDFGFVVESMSVKELVFKRWKKVESVLLVPKHHPLTEKEQITIEQIAGFPLILPLKNSSYRIRLEELFSSQEVKYRVAMESSNVELSSVYCEMGLGVAFATIVSGLPLLENRNLAMVPLDDFFPTEHIGLVMRKNIALTNHKNSFIDVLRQDIDTET